MSNRVTSASLPLGSQKLGSRERTDVSLGQGKYKRSLEHVVIPESKAVLKKSKDGACLRDTGANCKSTWWPKVEHVPNTTHTTVQDHNSECKINTPKSILI